VLCAMASKLDESVGRLVRSLKQASLWENTIIWAVSDNGGMTHWGDGFPASASSNWPLRGGKATLFEGGVRSASFITGGWLPRSTAATKYKHLLHVSDILPSLTSAAGIQLPADVPFDGVDAWEHIMNRSASVPRTEVPINIDTNPISQVPQILPHPGDGLANFSAVIAWPWKLILGVTCNPGIVGADKVMDGWWTVNNYSRILPPAEDPEDKESAMLFNLEKDEAEHHNVAAQNPEIVKTMTDRIQNYWANRDTGFVRAQLNVPMPLSNPKLHNWTWSPFRPSWKHSKYYKPQRAPLTQSNYVDE